ncbi:hypothetical protein RB534_25860, partial [Klebsiella pneumoniae]|uniref:hypothetical protein n=1 Tax=Klebsiella pneumoniae TaxID=573 RepID=UPI003D093ECE
PLHLTFTKNAIDSGHFGSIGKIVHKIFLVIVFIFVGLFPKPTLFSEQGRGWASSQGAPACHIGVCINDTGSFLRLRANVTR